MKETLLHLKQTLALIAAGEPSGPLGLLLVAGGVMLAIIAVTWITGKAAEIYGSMRYQDAEKRRHYLEGDE